MMGWDFGRYVFYSWLLFFSFHSAYLFVRVTGRLGLAKDLDMYISVAHRKGGRSTTSPLSFIGFCPRPEIGVCLIGLIVGLVDHSCNK